MIWRRLGWRGLRRAGVDGGHLARSVCAAHGATRCVRAMELLEELARTGDAQAVAAAWTVLELPLVEALPDCPPQAKLRLITACEAAAGIATHRETAKGLMAVRNSLLGGEQ
jgi:hypothetical protein